MFWVLKLEAYRLDLPALQRQQGLAMSLGGSGALAQVMGPDEELAEKIEDHEYTLCSNCAPSVLSLMDSGGH